MTTGADVVAQLELRRKREQGTQLSPLQVALLCAYIDAMRATARPEATSEKAPWRLLFVAACRRLKLDGRWQNWTIEELGQALDFQVQVSRTRTDDVLIVGISRQGEQPGPNTAYPPFRD